MSTIFNIAWGFIETTFLGILLFFPGGAILKYLEAKKENKDGDTSIVALGLWFMFGAIVKYTLQANGQSCP